jgi:hypothetical protein
MKRLALVASLALILVGGTVARVSAVWAPADLTIIEVKMTGTESVVIENTSAGNLDLSNYLLEYFNKAVPTNFSTPTDTQALPAVTLMPHQSLLLNGGSAAVCGAAAVDQSTMSFSDTAGYLTIVKVQAQSNGSLLYTQQDHISWTSATTGADVVKVPSGTTEPSALWYRKLSDGTWLKGSTDTSCALLYFVAPAATPTFVQWADGDEPVAAILADSSGGSDSGGVIPLSDLGLAAPKITELLPNVAAPQTDSEDEFIEVYNPNSVTFDLSGFILETGTTTKHDFHIPVGTTIAPKSFKAFYSIDTGISLSNSGGQAALLDPTGTAISASEAYGSAKDGQAWALANGQWLWTTTPTPGANNVINQPSMASSSKSSKAKTSSAGKVLGASTPKAGATSGSSFSNSSPKPAPLHPWTLAGVGGLALVYGGYEYRNDLANQLHRFRRYREARASARK